MYITINRFLKIFIKDNTKHSKIKKVHYLAGNLSANVSNCSRKAQAKRAVTFLLKW
jgi:hypothetical protein